MTHDTDNGEAFSTHYVTLTHTQAISHARMQYRHTLVNITHIIVAVIDRFYIALYSGSAIDRSDAILHD